MNDELVKRLRELQFITEHCSEQTCFECENRELCDKHDNKTLTEIYKQAADAIEELQGQIDGWIEQERKALLKSVPKWVPVTERLPLYGQDVLAVRAYGDGEKCQEVLMAHISVWNEVTGEKWWNATNITHWMPLPEPPKEEAE